MNQKKQTNETKEKKTKENKRKQKMTTNKQTVANDLGGGATVDIETHGPMRNPTLLQVAAYTPEEQLEFYVSSPQLQPEHTTWYDVMSAYSPEDREKSITFMKDHKILREEKFDDSVSSMHLSQQFLSSSTINSVEDMRQLQNDFPEWLKKQGDTKARNLYFRMDQWVPAVLQFLEGKGPLFAHNGNSFDFRVIKKAIERMRDDALCRQWEELEKRDTRRLFEKITRSIDISSLRLPDLCNEFLPNALPPHTALADSINLYQLKDVVRRKLLEAPAGKDVKLEITPDAMISSMLNNMKKEALEQPATREEKLNITRPLKFGAKKKNARLDKAQKAEMAKKLTEKSLVSTALYIGPVTENTIQHKLQKRRTPTCMDVLEFLDQYDDVSKFSAFMKLISTPKRTYRANYRPFDSFEHLFKQRGWDTGIMGF